MLFAVFFLFISCSSKHSEKSPNIVLFLVDDLGWQDTSVPFWTNITENNKLYRTPNMERLASKGVKFTEAYASQNCSPSRVSLMTGMNPARHRVTNWTLKKDTLNWDELKHSSLTFPDWNMNGISSIAGAKNAVFAKCLPELLRDKGYRTIHCGKAHFGAIGMPSAAPRLIGFNINIAGHAAGAPYSYYGEENFGFKSSDIWGVPGLKKYHQSKINLTEALTIEAISAMDQSLESQAPFFLYMSHYAVHTPLQGDSRFVEKYLKSGLDSIEANYASMIEGVDKSLGDILDYLEDNRIENNTIILFMSDNGGLSDTPPRGGVSFMHNYPLSSGKSSAREGGIRVPMMVSWKGKVSENIIDTTPIKIEDFFPTILELTNTQFNGPQILDGKSFVESINGTQYQKNDRALIWHFPNYVGRNELEYGFGPFSVIRKGKWKLIYYHVDSSFELFDLKNDISETRNLFESKNQIAQELAAELTSYLVSVNAQMPRCKKDGKQVEWPSTVINRLKNER
tara:strand:+ start:4318 stop:5850 length:1533 start_codon:yes stop_codon:yes gene_type:complete